MAEGLNNHVPDDVAATALVCTRNRPDDLARLLRSLTGDVGIEIFVIDQSDDQRSAAVVDDFASAGNVVYVKSRTRGKGAAMNEGLRLARTPIVVCTDDDCEARPGWVTAMTSALASRPRAAVLFCRVEAPVYDTSRGYVPEYLPTGDRRIRRPLQSSAHRGLGAGMAVRLCAVLELEGIDESFGPGARFGSGDDWDLEIRTMMRGWEAFETDKLAITHHGFRTFAEGRLHTARDWRALGAVAAKPVRAGHVAMLLMAAYVVVVDAVVPILRDLLRLRIPHGTTRVTAFCRGFVQGLMTPVDRTALKYRAVPETTRRRLSVPARGRETDRGTGGFKPLRR